jgi:hypothetical protein
MNSRFVHAFAWLAAALLSAGAAASELPPADGKPLSEIVRSVEAMKLGVITSVEFDDGLWEVKTRQGRSATKLYLDPRSGAERRRKSDDAEEAPPAGAKPLSAIIAALEEQKAGVITSVEFDDGYWEVKLRRDGAKQKIDIVPQTGARRR